MTAESKRPGTPTGGEEMTVLFADIAGSTRLTEELGDHGARDVLSTCLDLMEEFVTKHRGSVSRRIGDELLCLFPDADAGAAAAADLHSALTLAHRNGKLPRPVRLRIGFDHGIVVEQDGDLYGHTVNAAARLASLAKSGQTLTTKHTLERINPVLRMFARYFDSVIFKGIGGEQEVYDLPWLTEMTTRVAQPRARRAAAVTAIELEYCGKLHRVDVARPRLEIGRDVACDLAVAGDAVSMVHARVLWDRGRARIEDMSTNGTTIRRQEANAVTIRHEEASLLGAGLLCLGDPDDEDLGARIRYRCCEDGA
jgi:class 3 adenylate cyclase